MGSQGDVSEILSHPFFSSLDLDKLINKTLPPPYNPSLTEDFKYFD